MKIDLHLHTKKCKQGDGSKRNINTSDFIRKMRENNVAICAITNHNHFDIKSYEEIIKEDPDLLVFPGIELDIVYEEKQYHIIVICNPEKRGKFYKTFDNDLNRNYDTFYLEYQIFIEKIHSFNPEDIIIFPHFLDKDKKRALNIEMKDKLLNDIQNYLVILEPGKLQTMGVINAHNELSLIGSDVKDWDKYSQSELPEIKFKISSFKKFYELAKEPSVFISRYLNESPKYSIPVVVNETRLNNDVKVYRDLNIIFGEKGSGKTILLKDYIYPYFKEKGFNVFLHEGKDYNEQYKMMINNFVSSIEKNDRIINIIENKFDFIINYNELKPLDSIGQFKRYHNNVSANKNAKVIRKMNSKYSNNYTESFEEILSEFETDSLKIEEVKEINKYVRTKMKTNKDLLEEQLNNLKHELIGLVIEDYKNIFINNNIELFLTALKGSVHKKTGRESKPNNIGFAKLVSSRLNRAIANSELKQKLKKVKNVKVHNLGSIPNKGNVRLVTSIEVLKSDENYNDKKIFERNKIRRNREIIKKIEEFNFKDFGHINDYFSIEEKIPPTEFSHDVIKKMSVIRIAGNSNYTPSEGEKAIITISGYLENDSYDCYLFDEIERGLGQKYITDYIVPKLKEQRDKGKIIVVSTHNSNIAINTLPSQTIYCDYKTDSTNVYYQGNLYTNKLNGIEKEDELIWKDKALVHLEGSREMFGKRRNIYGI